MKNLHVLFVLGWTVILAACTKDSDPQPDPDPDPDPVVEVVTVSDPVFQSYLIANYDTDKDGQLSKEEATVVKELLMPYQNPEAQNSEMDVPDMQPGISQEVVSAEGQEEIVPATRSEMETRVSSGVDQPIETLSGIEQFTNLEILDISGHGLSEADLTQNVKLTTLDCSGNQLSELDLSAQTALTTLNCSGNKLSGALDVSSNTQLVSLDCSSNEITELDLSANTVLETLNCSSNQLSGDLNLSGSSTLAEVDCSGNEQLNRVVLPEGQETPAEVTADEGTSVVTEEDLRSVEFTDPDLKAYVVGLYDTDGDGEISKEEALAVKELDYKYQPYVSTTYSLKGMEYFTNLESLTLYASNGGAQNLYTTLEDFDVSHYAKLRKLVYGGSIQSGVLDLSHNPELNYLELSYVSSDDQMVDLSHNTKIDTLIFSVTGLSGIQDVTFGMLSALRYVYWGAKVNSLDLSNNANLKRVSVHWNPTPNIQLSSSVTDVSFRGWTGASLDFSRCTQLQTLSIFSAENLTTLDLSACAALESVTATSCAALQSIVLPKGSQAQVTADDHILIEGRGGIVFKDPELKAALVASYDTDGDGEISEEEALAVKSIKYTYPYLMGTPDGTPLDPFSLKGLDAFANLEQLNLQSSGIGVMPTLVDVDLSRMTKLRVLTFASFNANTPDLSHNTELTKLNLGITSLDKKMIDLSQNVKIDTIVTLSVQGLDENLTVDLGVLPELKYLAWYTSVQMLDLSRNMNLERVAIRFNNIRNVNLSSSVQDLALYVYVGTLLNLDHCTNLKTLRISGAENLTALDLTNCTALTSAYIESVPLLTSLKTGANTALQSLTVSSSAISSLDLSACTALVSVTAMSCPSLQTILMPQGSAAQVTADEGVDIQYQ